MANDKIILNRIKNLFQQSGLLTTKDNPVMTINRLPEGTHQVFLVKFAGQQYVVKFPVKKTLFDYQQEFNIQQTTAQAGISIPFIYLDILEGASISYYQANSQILNSELIKQNEIWQAVVHLLHELHHLPTQFPNDINIFKLIDIYQQKITGRIPKDLEGILSWDHELDRLRIEFSQMQIPSVPCHNDPMLNNFLLTPERLYLIDWEYAGNNDPCWDLASISAEAKFNSAQETAFLEYYFQNKIKADEHRRIAVYKVLLQYLWTLWCIDMKDFVDEPSDLINFAKRRHQKFSDQIKAL